MIGEIGDSWCWLRFLANSGRRARRERLSGRFRFLSSYRGLDGQRFLVLGVHGEDHTTGFHRFLPQTLSGVDSHQSPMGPEVLRAQLDRSLKDCPGLRRLVQLIVG